MAFLANGLVCVSVDRPAIQWLLRMCLLFILLSGFRGVCAQTEHSEMESQVKAAYLYKFGNFIEWPPSTFSNVDSPLRLGILGADALADELPKTIAGRTINGRPILVQKLTHEDSVSGINILFIGKGHTSRLAEILAKMKGHAVLTITESEDALVAGSMINFVTVDGKVRFEVAPRTARQGNLVISARLLAVAVKVASEPS